MERKRSHIQKLCERFRSKEFKMREIMGKQQKLKFAILDVYTLLLISFFLTIPNQKISYVFILFLISINVSASSILIVSNKKEIFVHFVVGKSKKKIILSYLKNDIIFMAASVFLILGTSFFLKIRYSCSLLFIYIVFILIILKTIITYLTVRRFL